MAARLGRGVPAPPRRRLTGERLRLLTTRDATPISAAGGRPTNSDWSYFNLQWGKQGAIVVLGWPGQWAAEFRRDENRSVRVVAGQELTRFKLLPGEEVRAPLTVLLFWEGDRVRSQNLWRRWMTRLSTCAGSR